MANLTVASYRTTLPLKRRHCKSLAKVVTFRSYGPSIARDNGEGEQVNTGEPSPAPVTSIHSLQGQVDKVGVGLVSLAFRRGAGIVNLQDTVREKNQRAYDAYAASANEQTRVVHLGGLLDSRPSR